MSMLFSWNCMDCAGNSVVLGLNYTVLSARVCGAKLNRQKKYMARVWRFWRTKIELNKWNRSRSITYTGKKCCGSVSYSAVTRSCKNNKMFWDLETLENLDQTTQYLLCLICPKNILCLRISKIIYSFDLQILPKCPVNCLRIVWYKFVLWPVVM